MQVKFYFRYKSVINQPLMVYWNIWYCIRTLQDFHTLITEILQQDTMWKGLRA